MSLIVPGYIQRDPDYFVTDFSEYAVGAQPPDWTKRHVTTGYTALVQSAAGTFSGKALQWAKTAAGRQFLSWDKIPLVADIEFLIRFRPTESAALNDIMSGVGARVSGAAAAETMYVSRVYYTTSVAWVGGHVKYVAGTGTNIGTPSGVTTPATITNVFCWQRSRFEGNVLSRKNWIDGNAEPVGWVASFTDTSIPGAGWAGLMNTSANPDVEIDFFSVAINGKTAPSVKR